MMNKQMIDFNNTVEAFKKTTMDALKNEQRTSQIIITNIPDNAEETYNKTIDTLKDALCYAGSALAITHAKCSLDNKNITMPNGEYILDIKYIIRSDNYKYEEFIEANKKLEELNFQTYEEIINYAFDNFTYDYSRHDNDDTTVVEHPGFYGAIIKHKAVCDGFTDYLYRACKRINIPVRKVGYNYIDENNEKKDTYIMKYS